MTQSSTIDRKAISAAEKAAARHARDMGEVVAGLMSTTRGREWVWEQLASAGIFASTYNDTPGRMAFDEGRRAMGLALLAQVMQWAPDNFIQAMREANERRDPSHRDLPGTTNGADGGTAPREPDGDEEPGRIDQGPASSAPTVDPATGEVRYN